MKFLWDHLHGSKTEIKQRMDLKNQLRTKKIFAKSTIFEIAKILTPWYILINRFLWIFTWSLQFAWIKMCEFIKKLYVHCM